MSFLTIAFPAVSALPVSQAAVSAVVMNARPLLGLGILATMLYVFKPLLAGMLRAAVLAIVPNKTREEKSALRTLRTVLTLRRMANQAAEFSPGMAAELNAMAARA